MIPKSGEEMERFKIPYGINESGELIPAESAKIGCQYKCPNCWTLLIHRAGDVRAKHFAHPPESNCSFESILHITAKRLIHNAIMDNARGQKTISLQNSCQNCGNDFLSKLPSGTFSKAALEVKAGDYLCDIMAYRDEMPSLAIEIFNTHKVDFDKSVNLPVHWIEITAEAAIGNPYYWVPTQAGLKESYCNSCKTHVKHIIEVADRFDIDRNLYSAVKKLNKSVYIADIVKCFKCKVEIPVFWWQGVPFCQSEPPIPKPKTIKSRYSKQWGGSYWANTCVNCNVIQGDNHLYLFDGAPFKGMPLSDEASREQSRVKVQSGTSATSEFMKVVRRNLYVP